MYRWNKWLTHTVKFYIILESGFTWKSLISITTASSCPSWEVQWIGCNPFWCHENYVCFEERVCCHKRVHKQTFPLEAGSTPYSFTRALMMSQCPLWAARWMGQFSSWNGMKCCYDNNAICGEKPQLYMSIHTSVGLLSSTWYFFASRWIRGRCPYRAAMCIGW